MLPMHSYGTVPPLLFAEERKGPGDRGPVQVQGGSLEVIVLVRSWYAVATETARGVPLPSRPEVLQLPQREPATTPSAVAVSGG